METVRILGVDTSLRSSGVAVIEVKGAQMRALVYGRVRNKPSLPHPGCLAAIYRQVDALITEFEPDEAVIEGAFFAKNAKTAMILGQARGTVMTCCALRTLPVYEYSPRSIKKAVVGIGSAEKDQVAKMVVRLLGLNEQPQEDAADALAAAICHAHQRKAVEVLRSTPL